MVDGVTPARAAMAGTVRPSRERGTLINGLAPMGGMSLGALGSTALAQLAPAPLHLVFVLLLALFAFQLFQTWRTSETAGGRSGALKSLRPSISVPPAARAELLAITPINVAVWALGGFYLSSMPSLIGKVTGAGSVWLGGLSVAALTLSGGVANLLAERVAAHRAAEIRGTRGGILEQRIDGRVDCIGGGDEGRPAAVLADPSHQHADRQDHRRWGRLVLILDVGRRAVLRLRAAQRIAGHD